MKKFKIHLGIFISLILLSTGCYDLNQYPADSINAGTFWNTETDAHEAMMGVYNAMKKDAAFSIYYTRDCLSDIGIGLNWGVYGFLEVAQGTCSSSSDVFLSVWQGMYNGVVRANTFIKNVDQVDMTDDLKAQYKAEARFMRALFYNELLNLYGGVPIYDETTDVTEDFANMLKSRSTADEVRSFILTDLEDAINLLPVKWDDSEYGRATKGAAYALKGKVLLYNEQYSEASEAFKEIVNDPSARGYGYTLYDDYTALFKPGGDASSEMIFAIQNIGGTSTAYGMPVFYIGNRASYGGCINCLVPSTQLVEMYENADGSPFNWNDVFKNFTTDSSVRDNVFRSTFDNAGSYVSTYPEYKDSLIAMYSNRDPRMQETILLPYTTYKGWVNNAKKDCEFVIPCGTESYGYVRNAFGYKTYLFRKFVPEYNMDGLITDRFNSPTNFPLIRYADVLLMLAECYNQTGNQTEAVNLINKVRTRSNMPGINSGPSFLQATTQAEVFERIKKERAVELAGEGIRFMDLKRWGLIESLDGQEQMDVFYSVLSTKSASSRSGLWPIPSSEIEKNSSLTQNTGW
jgi:starch-binding outer membrane protein, SusD/RagB family